MGNAPDAAAAAAAADYTVSDSSSEAAPGAGGGPAAAKAAAPAPLRKVAVFVAHGMGQQIPFETLDHLAQGLRGRWQATGGAELGQPDAATVKQDDKWLSRVRLRLPRGQGEVRTDIYEAYWAPLTEGRVTVRDVIRFLAGAALNGIQNGSQDFRRWVFGQEQVWRAPIRIVLYLLAALAVLVALVVMNAAIGVVAVGRSVLPGEAPKWLGDALLRDLTTTFNMVVTAIVAFALSLLVAWFLRRRGWRRALRPWGGVTVALMVLALGIIALGGVAVGMLFFVHAGGAVGTGTFWNHLLGPAVDAFNTGFQWGALLVVALLLLYWPGRWLARIAARVFEDLGEARQRWLTLLAAGFLVVVAVAALVLAWRMVAFARWDQRDTAFGLLATGVSWPLLVVASGWIRALLVQYMGDVAIYVRPYKLDRHYDLRDEIRQRAFDAARAVYAMRHEDGSRYDEVVVVGHSLGSVILYDVLNRLVMEDEAAPLPKMDVAGRTPLFLTFGSPLDKTAFIFGVQGESGWDAHQALAASVQPLVRDYQSRPAQWINIWSPWDVISGSLEFYDPPGSVDPKRVVNLKDPDATTLLGAHVEYGSGTLLYDKLLDAILQR